MALAMIASSDADNSVDARLNSQDKLEGPQQYIIVACMLALLLLLLTFFSPQPDLSLRVEGAN